MVRMFKSKKGQYDIARKSIFWMIAGVVITITVLAFAMILSIYQGEVSTVPAEYEAKLTALRFVNTAECFTYQDLVTGRIESVVIDIDKFTQERLDDCYRSDSERGYSSFNFGLSLVGFDAIDVDSGEEKILMTNNFFNKVDFTLRFPVIVRSGSEEFSTQLLVFVQEGI